MRTYTIKPDLREKAAEMLRAKVLPAHREIGAKVVGPFLSTDDGDTLFWMRGFPDAAAQTAMRAKFYGSALWNQELEGFFGSVMTGYQVTTVELPDGVVNWA